MVSKILAVSQASGTATARPQCAARSGRSQTAAGLDAKVASSPPRACDDEADLRNAAVTALRWFARSFRLGVFEAQVFRAIEQLEQLAALDAVDFVAASLDLRLADLVACGLRGGFRV